MKVNSASDLLFRTYYMIDWKNTRQAPSERKCVRCGGEMVLVGPAEDPKGLKYDGVVCHKCRRVIWLKTS